jgi:hypothetical protein
VNPLGSAKKVNPMTEKEHSASNGSVQAYFKGDSEDFRFLSIHFYSRHHPEKFLVTSIQAAQHALPMLTMPT